MLKKLIFIGCIFLFSYLSASYADSEALSLIKRLEEKISGVKSLETDFIQEKKMAVFSKAVVLEGKVFIQDPDLFAWHTDKPVRYIMVMKGDIIKQWDEDTKQVQVLSLSHNPTFLVAVNQMKVWFQGNYTGLLKDYDLKIINRDPIILEFIPKESAAAFNIIKKVIITFQQDERYIKRMDIEERNQDTTSLTFINTKLNIFINPSIWELK